ncbi:hypothetical protein [Thalassoroseus pseudoceratinae]|uniref:hypothetical protein n=1 Tax=Thalassoroseus pseudoceratinae TaxID=2713176 RepID=UPI00142105F8|nr:hypothetical protein [Thalassoroseus pseudoceratinae]
MARKKWIFMGVSFALLAMAACGAIFWALWQVPEFYTQAASTVPSDPKTRQQEAKELVQTTTGLVNDINHSDRWTATFEQSQVNSWVVEELQRPEFAKLVPDGIRDPRVLMQTDVLRLGFRMKYKAWDGIASVIVRPWVTSDLRLALEVEQIRAGLIPIPLEETLHELTQDIEEAGFDVEWRQSNGHDVAIIDLASNPKRAIQLESVKVVDGAVQIVGGLANAPKIASQPQPSTHEKRN